MPKMPEKFLLFVGTDLKERPVSETVKDHEEKVKAATDQMVKQGHIPNTQQMLTTSDFLITVVTAGQPIPSDLAVPRPTVLGAK